MGLVVVKRRGGGRRPWLGAVADGWLLMDSCRKAKGTGLQPCCCAIFVQGNNRNSTVNKNRQVKNFPSLSLLISFLMRNYPTPEE